MTGSPARVHLHQFAVRLVTLYSKLRRQFVGVSSAILAYVHRVPYLVRACSSCFPFPPEAKMNDKGIESKARKPHFSIDPEGGRRSGKSKGESPTISTIAVDALACVSGVLTSALPIY